MNEATFWNQIKTANANYWHATRIESSCGAGVADVWYGIHPNVQGAIELKYLPAFPKRPGTPILLAKWTPEQRHWLKMRGQTAGNAWLFVRIDRELFLWSWFEALTCDTLTADEWRKQATLWMKAPYDWYAFRQLLKGGQ